jgi:hypothetical protein
MLVGFHKQTFYFLKILSFYANGAAFTGGNL